MKPSNAPVRATNDVSRMACRGSVRWLLGRIPPVSVFLLGALLTFAADLPAEKLALLPPAASGPVDFQRDVKPILEASCVNCHGRGKAKGGFQLDTRDTFLRDADSGPAVVPGESARSHLIHLVAGVDPDNIMPEKGTRLTGEQVGILRAWIDRGVVWDPAISFAREPHRNLKPRRPELPPGGNEREHPLDRLLDAYFARQGAMSPPPVEDRVFARRAYLDIVGLLPTPAQIEAFLGDARDGRRQRLVRGLLADRQGYAQHWLAFWNDLLRNDYRGTGYIDGGRESIGKWLYAALLDNKPYDVFVRELVDPRDGPARGFTKGIVWRGEVNASQTPQLQAAQNVSQVFLGVNLKCASCHDSFIDDWQLADAYGMAGVYADDALELVQCDKPLGKHAPVKFLFPELGPIDRGASKSERVARLAGLVVGPDNGRFPRTLVNRLWARLMGRGLVEPLDTMQNAAWDADLLDWLAEDFVASGYNVQHTLERIMTSRAYRLPAVDIPDRSAGGFVFRGPAVRRLSAEQFRDALGQLTGVWYDRAEGGLDALPGTIRASLVAADPLAIALGRPNREQTTSVRQEVATTLQLLELTNGRTLATLLRRGAGRLAAEEGGGSAVVQRIFGQGLGRSPTPEEAALATEMVGLRPSAEGIEDLLWSIALHPEFQLVY